VLCSVLMVPAQEPANYGASCTPQTNPFLDNGPPSVTHPPPAGCGSCVYAATCQREIEKEREREMNENSRTLCSLSALLLVYGGRIAAASSGCEEFDSEQIGCCTHQRKGFNGCLMGDDRISFPSSAQTKKT
jgi:hypothetical protein